MGSDKRRHPRVPLNMVVQFRMDRDRFMQEEAANISMGGMFVRTAQPRPMGSTLFFQFLVDGRAALEGEGRVVHVGDGGMGLEFLSLSPASVAFVEALLDGPAALPGVAAA